MTGHRRSLLAAVLAAASLASGACSSPSTPEERLAAAIDASFADRVAYELRVTTDREALSALGDGADQVAAFLETLSLSGVRVPGDAISLTLELVGQRLIDVRSIEGGERVFLSLGIPQLAALVGADLRDPEESLGPALEAAGVDPTVREAFVAAVRGEWVGIEGRLDPAAVGGLVGQESEDPAAAERVAEALEGGVTGFLARFLAVEAELGPEGAHDYRVEFQLHALIRALATAASPTEGEDAVGGADLEAALDRLPETIPGRIETSEGLATAVVLDLAEAIRRTGAEVTGNIELVLTLSEHGTAPDVEAPEGAVTVTAEQFTATLQRFRELSETLDQLSSSIGGSGTGGTDGG